MARDGLDLAEPLVDGLIERRIEARAAERSRQIRILAAMAGSLLLHLPLLLAVLAVGCDQGRSKAHSESISLEAVETFIVEAVPEIPNPAPPATSMPQQATSADADTMDRDGKDQRSPSKSLERLVIDRTEWPKPALQAPPEVEPIQESHKAEPVEPDALESATEKPENPEPPKPTEAVAAEAPAGERSKPDERQKDQSEREPVKEPVRKVQEKAKHAERAEMSRAATAASRGPGKDNGGRATASHGDLVSYAALVRARVASHKPAGNGYRGTAVVSFGVSGGGSVMFASLASSSGSSTLDRAAVAAVRSAGPFPPPPDHSPRSFSVPFHFE
jgi:protein TonB